MILVWAFLIFVTPLRTFKKIEIWPNLDLTARKAIGNANKLKSHDNLGELASTRVRRATATRKIVKSVAVARISLPRVICLARGVRMVKLGATGLIEVAFVKVNLNWTAVNTTKRAQKTLSHVRENRKTKDLAKRSSFSVISISLNRQREKQIYLLKVMMLKCINHSLVTQITNQQSKIRLRT